MLFTNHTTSLKLSRIKWSSVTISKMVAAIALLVGMCLSRRAAQLRRHLRKRSAKVEALSHSHHSVSLEFSLIWFSGGREQHLHDAERKHKNWVKLKEKSREVEMRKGKTQQEREIKRWSTGRTRHQRHQTSGLYIVGVRWRQSFSTQVTYHLVWGIKWVRQYSTT